MSSVRVLMELRPAFEGYAGIPQEVRLLFSALAGAQDVEVAGLINHPINSLKTARSAARKGQLNDKDREIASHSKFVISTKPVVCKSRLARFFLRNRRRAELAKLVTMAWSRIPYQVHDFSAQLFADFVWQTLFSKSLSSSDFNLIKDAQFKSIRPAWNALHQAGLLFGAGLYPRMNTVGYDAFVAQTPWPGAVSKDTSLVIRYHDAIPLLFPHTIPHAKTHQASHYMALRENRRDALFACTSHATRKDLLKVFPDLEKRSVVIPDIVSSDYFIDGMEVSNQHLSKLVEINVAAETEPKFDLSREKERFYSRALIGEKFRYIMMVSTLEPRKNHAKLIAAWAHLKSVQMSELKLIVVGTLGWDCDGIIEAMRPWQQRGELFHLHRVPAASLRHLYRHSAAVVCPSVAEGFDVSGVEAMLSGAAVVASDIEVHREIYGDAADYFNPYSTIDQAQAILRVIGPDRAEYRNELIRRSARQGAQYKGDAITPLWSDFLGKIKRKELVR